MNIRALQPQDILACARLMAVSPLWQRYGVKEASAARRFEAGLSRQATIAVAERESEICGFIWYETYGAFARSGYVVLVGVQPGLHRQGIGQALMEHAEQHMFLAVNDVFLLVSDFNTTAQRFYQRLGYRPLCDFTEYRFHAP